MGKEGEAFREDGGVVKRVECVVDKFGILQQED